MIRVSKALGIRDVAILEEYAHKFSGRPTFRKIYQIFNSLPEADQKKLSDAGDDYDDETDLPKLYKDYVRAALLRAYKKGMKVLENRNATKKEAALLTELVDQKYDELCDEWVKISPVIGDDATLLHRLLSLGELDWAEEINYFVNDI